MKFDLIFADYTGEETEVVIPEGVTVIGRRAFDGYQNLTIHASKGSEAEEYAKEEGIQFEEL